MRRGAERTENMDIMINTNQVLEKRAEGINKALDMMEAGFSVSYKQVPKNNCTKDALVMNTANFNMLPTVYPDHEMLECF